MQSPTVLVTIVIRESNLSHNFLDDDYAVYDIHKLDSACRGQLAILRQRCIMLLLVHHVGLIPKQRHCSGYHFELFPVD